MLLKQKIQQINKYANKSALANYKSYGRELLKEFGNIQINAVNADKINAFIYRLKTKNKPATINAKIIYLNKIFSVKIKTLKIRNGKTNFLTKGQVLQLNRYFKINNLDYMRKIILIGVYTGLRIQNIININPADIDNGYLRVWYNKTDRPYSVPIKKRLAVILNEAFKPFDKNYQTVYYEFKKACNTLNLTDTSPHTLRHTFCSWLAIKGVSAPIIKTLANHSNISMTDRYIHLSNKALEGAISLI